MHASLREGSGEILASTRSIAVFLAYSRFFGSQKSCAAQGVFRIRAIQSLPGLQGCYLELHLMKGTRSGTDVHE